MTKILSSSIVWCAVVLLASQAIAQHKNMSVNEHRNIQATRDSTRLLASPKERHHVTRFGMNRPNPRQKISDGQYSPRDSYSKSWALNFGYKYINSVARFYQNYDSWIVDSTGNLFISHDNGPSIITEKFDSNGVKKWERQYDQINDEGIEWNPQITADNNGNVYVRIPDTVDVLIKYDSTGNQEWIKSLNGCQYYNGWSVDKEGSVCVVSGIDLYGRIQKYHTSGALLWERFWVWNPEDNETQGYFSISVDDECNIYLFGSDQFDYVDPEYTTYQYLFRKYDKDGNLQWENKYPNEQILWEPLDAEEQKGDIHGNTYLLMNEKLIKWNEFGNKMFEVSVLDKPLKDCYGLEMYVDYRDNIYFQKPDENDFYVFTKYNSNMVEKWTLQENLYSPVFDKMSNIYMPNSIDPSLVSIYDSNGVKKWEDNDLDPNSWIRNIFLDAHNNIYVENHTYEDPNEIIKSITRYTKFKPELSVYHYLPTIPQFSTPYLISSENSKTCARICADSSSATLIQITTCGQKIADKIKLRIAEDTLDQNPREYGMLQTPTISDDKDTIRYIYTHPEYINPDSLLRHLSFQLVDKTTNYVWPGTPFELYRAPVLMVHGLWDDPTVFYDMGRTLAKNLWPSDITWKLLHYANYSATNASYFSYNSTVVRRSVNELINKARYFGYSSGKVDVVCHSMGGILARLYLQKTDYQNNIHRLITLNTPFYGSQTANMIKHPKAIALKSLLNCGHRDYNSGAVDDLMVHSIALQQLNEKISIEHKVPTHTIRTTASYEDGRFWKEKYILDVAAEVDFFDPPFMPDVNTLISKLFNNDDNDLVVPVQSQHCGIDKSTYLSNIYHSASPHDPDVINRVITLIKSTPSDNLFSLNGFIPGLLPEPILTPTEQFAKQTSLISGTVTITAPIEGTHYNIGDSVVVSANGTGDVSRMMGFIVNDNLIEGIGTVNAMVGSFGFRIPDEALGSLYITVLGYNESGLVALDTVNILTNLNAQLDSLRAMISTIYIAKGETTGASFLGFYYDSLYLNLSNNPDLTLLTNNVNVAEIVGNHSIKGVDIGITKVIGSYQGNTDTITVEVLPPNAWTPVDSIATIQCVFTPSWNLLSVPLLTTDNKKSVLFSNASSDAFAYRGSYIQQDTLKAGVGYWLKFATADSLSFTGFPIITETISVQQSWNMIGSISKPISVSSITSDPPNIVTSDFFGYNGSYVPSDTIYPGFGYWIKASQEGKLILSSTTQLLSKARIKIVPTSELPPAPPSEITGHIEFPKEYRLEQNYPNPFNPITTIRYSLPFSSNVKLKIYNVLGQVVTTLKDEEESAGYKQIEWNSSEVASGIYFYRLEATSISDPSKYFLQVKKMLLLK